MLYIQPQPNSSGAYPALQSTPGNGLLKISHELASELIQYGGFATLTVSGQSVISVTPDLKAWKAWKADYPDPSPEQADAQQRITELKDKLRETDYQAIKYAEGWITAEDYEPIKTQRQAWRDEINTIETADQAQRNIMYL